MIKCDNITKTYLTGGHETHVLKGVSLAIDKGEFVAIIGPSGSGKSTLMHILGALDSATSGKYFFEGEDVSELSEDALANIRRHRIGFVFQSFNLLPRASVLRNVMLPLVYAETPVSEREDMVKKALISAGLPEELWGNNSNQLSGGQMQRVAIARALVNSPSLILADEPTGNLDTETGKVVLNTFRSLNENEGHTIILITHEQEVAMYANRVIQIRDGYIIKDEKR